MLCPIIVRTESPDCLPLLLRPGAFGNHPSFLIAIAIARVCMSLCMTDGAAVSGWNGPEGEPAKPMNMRDYIAAAKHTPRPEASRALTTPPVPAPSASRAQLPSIDNAWHFKGARGQNVTPGYYVAADLLARWSEKLLVAAIEMTLF